MRSWKEIVSTKTRRHLLVPALAVSMAAAFAGYEGLRPMVAEAAITAPAPSPLDDNSVSALLSLDHAMENLAARVTPAIVNVTVTSRTKAVAEDQMPEDMQRFFGQFFGGRMMSQPQPRIEHGLGSGVIISPDGYIVTNNHVINGAVDIRVTLSDGRVLPAKLIGADTLTDLAVLKVKGENLPSIPWGDSTKLRPGQTVLAFGNPFGFRFTVTRGIVSGLNRPNPYSDDPRKPGEFIQTDAAINEGNSGGPLVDARGEVVGINTFLISPSGAFSGMGFAIPTQIAKPTAESLMRYGKVAHGYMGIGINDVTADNARFFDLNKATGAVVTQVDPSSPAAKGGLKIGDVVISLDGHPVRDAGQLQVEVGQKRPGTTLHLEVLRDGRGMNLSITLVEMGQHAETSARAGHEDGKPRWGLGLSDLTPDIRQQLRTPADVHGAVIEHVVPGSPADNAGLQSGDVIESINRRSVKDAGEAQRVLATVGKGQDTLVLVWSDGGSTFRVLHPGEGA